MKKTLTALIILIPFLIFGQKTVILTKYPQEVPSGKKWILPTNQEILIEVNYGVLNSGSMCNARFLSKPGIVSAIVEGNYGRPNEVYGIIFKEVSKVAYTNNYTYSIVPVAIVNSDFSLSELFTNKPEDVGERQIIFMPGEKVYVGTCLTSIQVIEKALSNKEIAVIRKKEDDKRLADEKKIKDAKEKKKLEELEFINKVKNSNEYFYSNKLDNEKKLKISIHKNALTLLNDYFKEFKQKYPDGYKYKLKIYKRNIGYALSRGDRPEDYSLLDLSLYFSKTGKLQKIENERILFNGEGLKDIEIPEQYINKLTKLITLNRGAIIKIEEKEYTVNSYFISFITPIESSTEQTISFSKNKKGEIKFLTIPEISEEIILSLISNDNKTMSLEKGKYQITIKTVTTKLRATHFQNFNKKEIIKEIFIDRIITKIAEL